MAFSDEGQNVFSVDLTTRVGVHSALQHASNACGVFTAVFAYGTFRILRIYDLATVPPLLLILAAYIFCSAALATWRIRMGKGAFAGAAMLIALVVLPCVSLLIALAEEDGFSLFVAIPIAVGCFVIGRFVFIGLRAGRVLKSGAQFQDDIAEIFQ